MADGFGLTTVEVWIPVKSCELEVAAVWHLGPFWAMASDGEAIQSAALCCRYISQLRAILKHTSNLTHAFI